MSFSSLPCPHCGKEILFKTQLVLIPKANSRELWMAHREAMKNTTLRMSIGIDDGESPVGIVAKPLQRELP